mmetsp:Transcript_1391/g.2497  ORF Transcript_1391/g.2497 Transcript_1391/m.2497 type:complete len:103 (-) Transcript_1391:2304-2612(-)
MCVRVCVDCCIKESSKSGREEQEESVNTPEVHGRHIMSRAQDTGVSASAPCGPATPHALLDPRPPLSPHWDTGTGPEEGAERQEMTKDAPDLWMCCQTCGMR